MRDRDPVTGVPSVSTGTRSGAGAYGVDRGPQPSPNDPTAMSGQNQQGGSPLEQGRQAADQAMGAARDKAQEVAGQAGEAVDKGMDRAAEGLDSAADMIREKGAQAGSGSGVQSSAAMVADKLDAASGYLRDKDSDQLIADLESLVRRKPAQSLLVAAGVGFVLSKILR